jgi:hypothetical protein
MPSAHTRTRRLWRSVRMSRGQPTMPWSDGLCQGQRYPSHREGGWIVIAVWLTLNSSADGVGLLEGPWPPSTPSKLAPGRLRHVQVRRTIADGDAACLEQLLRRRSRVNSVYLAAPALDGLRPCFLRGGSPGGDALTVVDVHEPSEQRSSVRPVGPSLRAVAPRESLMVTHRIMVHRPSSARSCAFSATSPFMASRAFAFRSFSRAMCSSGVSSRSDPGVSRGRSRACPDVGVVILVE